MKKLLSLALLVGLMAVSYTAEAQQKIGYVDSEYILEQIPEVATIQQSIDRLAQDWQAEIDEQRREVEQLFNEYKSRELLYTQEERDRKQQEIIQKEEEVERLRMKYFGPEGDLFREQDQQMRPIQEKVLEAIEEVAAKEGYDYVFDKSGDFLFLFLRDQYDLSDLVLEELGIDLEDRTGGR